MSDLPSVEQQYRSLIPVATEDTREIVWDQLSDEQSREVQQHESRFYSGDRYGRGNHLSIAGSAARQTANAAGRCFLQVGEKAKIAALEWWRKCETLYKNNVSSTKNRMNKESINYPEFDLQFGIQGLLRQTSESSLSVTTKDYNCYYSNTVTSGSIDELSMPTEQEEVMLSEQQPLKGYPFVALKEGRDVPDAYDYNTQSIIERDQWGLVGNLDVFLAHLYKYFYHRGLTPMLCSFLVETTCLLFTIWLTRLLLIDINWTKLLTMNCDDESAHTNDDDRENNGNICHSHLSDYARSEPLSWTYYLLIQGYTYLLLVYAFFKSWVFYQDFFGYAIQCRTILHDKLGLSERKLQGGALSWNDVVTKLAEGQQFGIYKIIHYTSTANKLDTRFNRPSSQGASKAHFQEQLSGKFTSEQSFATMFSHDRTASSNAAPPAAVFDLPATPSGLQQQHKQNILDPLQIAQRIMRKENFLLAFWNAGLLDCTKIVFPWSDGGDETYRHFWCDVLEWSFYQCVLNFMFNHKYELRPAFCLDSSALKRRLKVCGMVHFCLLPFLLVFMVLNFFLRHVYDSKMGSSSSDDMNGGRGIMGQAKWSSAAFWQFREFNELPHAFEKRMEPSYKAASEYCNLFGASEYLAAMGKLMVFFGGSIGGVLLVLGVVVNDTLLLHVQLWGRNLVWYAGVAGITYSIGKALETTKEAAQSASRNIFQDMDAALEKVSHYTHYYPEHWKGRGWDSKVYSSFKTLFDSEVKLFLYELIALVLTPYILYFRLSEKASDICEFCLLSKSKLIFSTSRITVDAIGNIGGDICGFSTFDFEKFGDKALECKPLGRSAILQQQREEEDMNILKGKSVAGSIMRTANLEDTTQMLPKPRSRHRKMEKSFDTFQKAHPDWNTSFQASGRSTANRTEEHRLSAEKAIIARERELYIQAATRQLKTLVRIEEEQKLYTYDMYLEMESLMNFSRNKQHHAKEVTKSPLANAVLENQNQVKTFPLLSSMNQHYQHHNQPPLQRSLLTPLPSTNENLLQLCPENLDFHIKNTSHSPLSPFDDSAADKTVPTISVSLPPTNNVSIIQQTQASRQMPDDDTVYHSHDYTQIERSATSATKSFLFQSRNDVMTSSYSSGGFILTPSRLCSSIQPGKRYSQSQHHWLERFHEHLRKQEEEIKYNWLASESSL